MRLLLTASVRLKPGCTNRRWKVDGRERRGLRPGLGADAVVTFLADKGAKLDARNKLGWTALMLAEGVFTSNTEKSWPSTAALLRKLMAERGLNPELYTQTAALQNVQSK